MFLPPAQKANTNREVRAMISARTVSDKPFSPSGNKPAVLKVGQNFSTKTHKQHKKEEASANNANPHKFNLCSSVFICG
jgi:hypothetical protein